MGYKKQKTGLKNMGHHDRFCTMSIFRTPLFGNFIKNDVQMTVIINGASNIK